jgi:hypothetical protein
VYNGQGSFVSTVYWDAFVTAQYIET